MKFDNILIMSDLDGTFTDSKSQIVPRNIGALRYFTGNGGRFGFATGRLPYYMEHLNASIKGVVNAPCIICNGAALYDYETDETFEVIPLNNDIAAPFVEEIKEKYPMISHRHEWIDGFGILRYSFDGTPESVDEIRDIYGKKYEKYFALMKPCNDIYEFQDVNATKGLGIGRLRKHLLSTGKADSNLKIFAVGDYENDLAMLKAADVACCPANAIDEVKAICKIHLCHCDGGAIADLIDKIEKDLIPEE